MNNIQIFNFKNNNVRTIIKDEEPYFCAKDVCDILELTQTSRAISKFKDGVTISKVIDVLGREQEANFINEKNLYKLIFQSRKPEAENFIDWVTGEVLPEIRKTGKYAVQKVDLNDPKILRGLLSDYSERVEKLEEEKKYNQPKVDFFDRHVENDGLYNLQSAGRHIMKKPNKFIQLLKSTYIYYQNNNLVPYVQYIKQGLFEVKVIEVNGIERTQTFVTPKGIRFFDNLFNNR